MTAKTQTKKPEMTPEQKEALTRFAATHGRTWRSKLRTLWATGKDEQSPDSAYLRQVRNEHAHALNSFVQGAC